MSIVFITGHGDIPMSVQAMKAGAVEFLTKPFSDETLISAIRQATERSRNFVTRAAEAQALQLRYASLSSREQQVMALVVVGLLNKQVGFKLGISEITVKAPPRPSHEEDGGRALPDLVDMAAKLGVAAKVARSSLGMCQRADCASSDPTFLSAHGHG